MLFQTELLLIILIVYFWIVYGLNSSEKLRVTVRREAEDRKSFAQKAHSYKYLYDVYKYATKSSILDKNTDNIISEEIF